MGGNREVVVTGMSALSPAGLGLGTLWRAVRDGRPCGAPIGRFDSSRHASRIAAEVPEFEAVESALDPADLERMDRVTRFAVVTARAAVADADLDATRLDPRRAGVCIGTAIGGVESMERAFMRVCRRNGDQKPQRVSVRTDLPMPSLYPAFAATSVSSEVARDRGFLGPCTAMATGCTAGLDAIGTAADLIRDGAADVMITGGADAPVTPIVVASFDVISCLTRRNDAPARASRPFDRDRDGFLLAEGCAVLVLEHEGHARLRRARIWGRVLGFASLSNAFHMTGLPPDGVALARTLRRALAAAGLGAEQVDYINAHGSSTLQNDRNETAAFKTVFGARAPAIPISSTKSVLGHALGAASALETVVCLLALNESVVPPTANYETPDPDCDLDYVPNEPREARLRVVECNASGFSGIHSSLLLGHPEWSPR